MGSGKVVRDPERVNLLADLIGSVQSAVVWVFDWDLGAFTFVGGGMEQLLGYSREEWLAPEFWLSRLHPEDAGWAADFCYTASQGGQSHEFAYRMLHRDGSTVWVRDIVTVDEALGTRAPICGLLVDITQQKVAEEALLHSERRYHALVEEGDWLAASVDESGVLTYVSVALCALIGESEDALLGRPLDELISQSASPEDIWVRRLRTEGRFGSGTLRVPLITGHGERLVELQSVATFEHGSCTGASLMGRDVTEELISREEIVASRDLLERLLGMIDSGVVVVDRGNLVVSKANGPAAKMFGYELADMVGVSAVELFPGISTDAGPDTRTPGGLKGGESASRELVLQRRDGTEFEADVTVRPLSDDHGDLLVIVRDVTYRNTVDRMVREGELRFRHMVEQAPFGLHFYRMNGDRLVFAGANPAAAEMLGLDYESLEGADAGVVSPLMTTDELELINDAGYESSLFAAMDVATIYTTIARDGGVWHTNAIMRDDGQIRGALDLTVFQTTPGDIACAFTDTTERVVSDSRERQHHARVSALATQLASAEERERRHLAEELHDRVSQPLAVARMHLSAVLADESDPDALSRAVLLVDEAIREARTLTTELSPPVLYELGLPAALRWLGDEMRRKHRLYCVVSVDCDDTVSEDAASLLFRAARELLMNVVKHARDDRAWLSLGACAKHVMMTVEDRGTGFEDDCDSGPDSGVGGFGLFSVRERVANMGGTLEVESRKGEGTRVTVVLPRGV